MKKLIVLTVVLLTGCSNTSTGPSEYDKYVDMCHRKGGLVSVADVSWSTVTSKCVGNSFDELMGRFTTA